MKNFPTFTLIILLALMGTACKKIDQFTQFNMEFDNSATIPSTIGINIPIDIITPTTTTNSESTFEVNDTRKDKIEQIILTDLDLTVTSPSNTDFSFLKSIALFINADGLNETQIASKSNIADTTTVLVMETTGADLQEYIKKDQFNLRVNAETDELITQDHVINVHQIFWVDALVLGQ
ncbi:hypothetical protein K6119_19335 [Paracrocinitomix mangrovi]|uniref:hypothetical protein n=1 Tax=Paracrocinitomix mangrovi TaxID=2862509 RepID=UPI001C8DB438|nr:hypothetical protein [Paracrocinitomix mangrovi]UKN01880.1 hypothetical protein K6119_19335 [Paracrocinitomix mangrovi]